MPTFLTLFLFLLIAGCAKSTPEKVLGAIDIAFTKVDQGDCSGALKILNDVGMQAENGLYLQALSSAYACFAKYDEIDFVSTQLTTLDTSTPQSIMTSIAAMPVAAETVADSSDYSTMRSAINILLNSTTGSPSQIARDTRFGVRRSGDMGVQALMMNVVNLGKFMRWYGNTDATGAKGAGPSGNLCFIKYNDPRAITIVSGPSGGACNTPNSGSVDIDQTTATGKRRMCEGLMFVTNILDILDNIDLSGSSSLSTLEQVSTQVSIFRTAAIAAGLGTLMGMTSQSTCETFITTPANLLDLEYLYAIMFESGLQ